MRFSSLKRLVKYSSLVPLLSHPPQLHGSYTACIETKKKDKQKRVGFVYHTRWVEGVGAKYNKIIKRPKEAKGKLKRRLPKKGGMAPTIATTQVFTGRICYTGVYTSA